MCSGSNSNGIGCVNGKVRILEFLNGIAGSAPTGLINAQGGLPRAPLADSLCPELTSGCAFGAKKGRGRRLGSMMRTRWCFDPGRPRPRRVGLPCNKVPQRSEIRDQRSVREPIVCGGGDDGAVRFWIFMRAGPGCPQYLFHLFFWTSLLYRLVKSSK